MTAKTYQVLYFLEQESCSGCLTEDEISQLITNPQAMQSLTFIGTDAKAFDDDVFRKRVCDKALDILNAKEADNFMTQTAKYFKEDEN